MLCMRSWPSQIREHDSLAAGIHWLCYGVRGAGREAAVQAAERAGLGRVMVHLLGKGQTVQPAAVV